MAAAPKKMIPAELRRQILDITSRRAEMDNDRRFKEADKIRSKSKTLLDPNAMLSGEQDIARLIDYMTLMPDGSYRPITLSDVKQFDAMRGKLRSRFKAGITATDILRYSQRIPQHQKRSDFDKAREQIKTCIPLRLKGSEMRFMTNTGPGSDHKRQYVTIRFNAMEAALSSAKKPMVVANDIIKGPLSINCSCGQFRFVFAYVATSGGFGLPQHRETAYPKIRNPQLTGVACKHVVKVASWLRQSPTAKSFVAGVVERERQKTQTKTRFLTKEEMKAVAKSTALESERTQMIRKPAERRKAEAIANMKVRAKARAKARAPAVAGKAKQEIELNTRKLLQAGAITKSQADVILKALKGGS